MYSWQKPGWLRLVAILNTILFVAFVLLCRGSSLFEQAQLNRGYLILNRALTDDPATLDKAIQVLGHTKTTGNVHPRSLYGLGFALVTAGRTDEALQAWDELDGVASDLANHAQRAEDEDKPVLALAWYDLASSLEPDSGDYLYQRARTSSDLGKSMEARQLYLAALNAPRLETVGRSDILTQLGWQEQRLTVPDWPAALDHYDSAIDNNDFMVPALEVQAYWGRAATWQELNNPGQALADLRRVVALRPEHYWGNIGAGRLVWEVDSNLEAAESFLETAIISDPTRKWAYRWLGEIYFQAGEVTAAREMLEQVLIIDPQDNIAAKRMAQLSGSNEAENED